MNSLRPRRSYLNYNSVISAAFYCLYPRELRLLACGQPKPDVCITGRDNNDLIILVQEGVSGFAWGYTYSSLL